MLNYDFKNINSYGKANFLSKLRELKTLKSGSNYNDENSYQRKIIDDSYYIDVSGLTTNKISGSKIMNMDLKVKRKSFTNLKIAIFQCIYCMT